MWSSAAPPARMNGINLSLLPGMALVVGVSQGSRRFARSEQAFLGAGVPGGLAALKDNLIVRLQTDFLLFFFCPPSLRAQAGRGELPQGGSGHPGAGAGGTQLKMGHGQLGLPPCSGRGQGGLHISIPGVNDKVRR